MLNQSSPLDLAFQALADPTRRTMVERLTRGPASVSDLARPLSMSLPAVMQHLAVLEGSGLVVSEKIGRVRTRRISSAGKKGHGRIPLLGRAMGHAMTQRITATIPHLDGRVLRAGRRFTHH